MRYQWEPFKGYASASSLKYPAARAILIRLVPVYLLLGRLPSLPLLKQYSLPEFLPLIEAFRSGNIPAWRRELDMNREWYRRRSVWLLVFERGEILVWRNLFRQRSAQ